MRSVGPEDVGWVCDGGVRIFETHAAMTGDRVRRLEELAFTHGRYSESYLATEPNRSYLWSSCDEGVVGFVREGKHLLIVGGLLTHESNRARFLHEIRLFAMRSRTRVVFYHVDDRDIPLFEQAGFQITKYGVEARIPLAGHNWHGKSFEWVRRQFNFVSRHGVVCREWGADELTPTVREQRMAELHEVSAEHIQAKHFRGEIPFFEGRLLEEHLYRRRCFVALADNGAGRVEGFLLCTPIDEGRQWAIEMYRHRQDAVRGVIPFLMHQAIEKFKSEGRDGVSMCPVPAIGCDAKRPGDSFVTRMSLVLWNRMGNGLFDTKGLFHYKSRFRPEFRDIFVCASSPLTLGSIWAYLKVTRAFDLKFSALLKDLFHLCNPQRRTLAKQVAETRNVVPAEQAGGKAA